jgi:hypothetical protein
MKPARGPAALCLAALLLLAGCGEEDSIETQINIALTELEKRAEAGERRPFMALVADEFVGQNNMTKDEFQRFFVMQWNRYQALQAQIMPITVEHREGDRARATFRAFVTGGRGIIPENGQMYDVTTLWVREDGDWLLSGARWEPVFD